MDWVSILAINFGFYALDEGHSGCIVAQLILAELSKIRELLTNSPTSTVSERTQSRRCIRPGLNVGAVKTMSMIKPLALLVLEATRSQWYYRVMDTQKSR